MGTKRDFYKDLAGIYGDKPKKSQLNLYSTFPRTIENYPKDYLWNHQINPHDQINQEVVKN